MESKVIASEGINSLKIKGKVRIKKSDYKISIVRSIASRITGDTGKRFSVTTDPENKDLILVTRKS